eukprot:5620988-Pleurochrysis_carterae.AAC.1
MLALGSVRCELIQASSNRKMHRALSHTRKPNRVSASNRKTGPRPQYVSRLARQSSKTRRN